MRRTALLVVAAACGSTSPPKAQPRPVASAAPLDAPILDAAAAVDAAPVAAASPDAVPPAAPRTAERAADRSERARICLQRIHADLAARHVDFDGITSVKNVRIRLGSFGRLCGNEFPIWAPAAAAASTQGIGGRRRIFAELVRDACPAVATAPSGREVVDACPTFVGETWRGAADAFLRRVDSGTFAFATLLSQSGFGTFAEELALQATMHPELDR